MPAKPGENRLLSCLGGESGCKRLSKEFYSRVSNEPALRSLFSGKSLRCATEEFAAFLIQFLDGDADQTQHRWWLSLRESHSRFQIDSAQRNAWLKQMEATLESIPLSDSTRRVLKQFFVSSSAYIVGQDSVDPKHEELNARWREQKLLDEIISAIAAGHAEKVLALAPHFESRPSVFAGLLARMAQSGRATLIDYVIASLGANPALSETRFAGRTLSHFAAGAGCAKVVAVLLRLGVNPNLPDSRGHAPLYFVANECVSETGPEIVRALVRSGADVNANGGVTRATALHMAARRGFVEIARALLDCGAEIEAKDRKGVTPLGRSMNCRKDQVSKLLIEYGALDPTRRES